METDLLYTPAQAATLAETTIERVTELVNSGSVSPDFHCFVPMMSPAGEVERVFVSLFSMLGVEQLARVAGSKVDEITAKVFQSERILNAAKLHADGAALQLAAEQGRQDSERYFQLKRSMGLNAASVVPVIDSYGGPDVLERLEQLTGGAATTFFRDHEPEIKEALKHRVNTENPWDKPQRF